MRWLVASVLALSLGTNSSLLGQTLPVPDDFLFGTKWGPSTFGTPGNVTWSFQTINASQVELSSFMPSGFEDEIRAAFQTWSDVAGITFLEVPTGGRIRLYGQALDGPGNTAAQAQYPGAGTRFIRFDTGNSWTTDPSTNGSDIYQLALHEIGHSIGLRHPPGVIAAMNHVVSRAYDGLLPIDIAGAQAIYGPSATIDNSLYLPTNVRTLSILPGSQLTATVSLGTFFSASDSTNLTGTIDARVEFGAGGSPTALTFYGGDVSLTDVSVNVSNVLLTGKASFTGLAGDLFAKNWFGPTGSLLSVVGGQFDVSKLVLGLVDGLVDYDIQVPIAGINLSDSLELKFEEEGPIAFGTTDLGQFGTIDRVGNDLFIDLPLNVVSTLMIPVNGGELPIEVRVGGTIHAYAAVPESKGIALLSVLVIVVGIYFIRVGRQT